MRFHDQAERATTIRKSREAAMPSRPKAKSGSGNGRFQGWQRWVEMEYTSEFGGE